MLKGKTVLLGVTGSIAAYKIAYLASALKKLHADVHVLMTKNATNFINPITFESLTGNKSSSDPEQTSGRLVQILLLPSSIFLHPRLFFLYSFQVAAI